MDAGGWSRIRTLLVVIGVAVVAYGLVQQLALPDLRRLERDYIAARDPTACATQSLLPHAFAPLDEDELDRDLLAAIRRARDESVRLRTAFESRRVVPFPPVRSARAALEDALDKQVALYDAMLETPDESEDELRKLGFANTAFERRIARARNLLFVGEGSGWSRRFICDEEATSIPLD